MASPEPLAPAPLLPAPRLPNAGAFVLASFASLFLQLLLIRWLGTEIRIFAYFSNLVLVTCLLGLGMGYALSRYRIPAWITPACAALLMLAARPELALTQAAAVPGESPTTWGFREISMLLAREDVHTWAGLPASPAHFAIGFGLLLVLLLLLFGTFVPLGAILGEYMAASPKPLRAYSLNVVASLAGTWAFVAVNFAGTTPPIWLLVAMLAILPALAASKRDLVIGGVMAAVAVGLAAVPTTPVQTFWSPYHKLLWAEAHHAVPTPDGSVLVKRNVVGVNGTYYQTVHDLRPETLAQYPALGPPENVPYLTYNMPYRLKERPGNVLVVGAGTGNDVAAALRNGAGHVDAVEIDPVILQLGRDHHPEQPYSSDRVTAIVDDARAFFKRSPGGYDLIVFGLLDSHVLTSNFSNTNLDSYVYTRESIAEARRLLAPGGILLLKFEVRSAFLYQRLKAAVEWAFEEPPLTWVLHDVSPLLGTPGYFFVAGDIAAVRGRVAADPRIHAALTRLTVPEGYEDAGGARATTDDWPYIYLRSPTVPILWRWLILAQLALAAIALSVGRFPIRSTNWRLFFLGAAFMLLETNAISRANLFYGSTWITSALVITAVLVMVLLGNWLWMRRIVIRPEVAYAGLLALVLVNWLVGPAAFAPLGLQIGSALACVLAAAPLAFAAVIFAAGLSASSRPELALASNLLGAMIGGLLGSLGFVVGLRHLLLVAAALYVLSWVVGRHSAGLPRSVSAGSA